MSLLRVRRVLSIVLLALPALLARADEPESAPPDSMEAFAPDPATPAEAPKAISYVENRGVVFRTPDGLFEGSLGFNFQGRFTHFDFDAATTGVDSNEFRVRRFKLFLSGFALDPRLTWRFQADFAAASARLFDDGWMNWKFSDAASVQFGQYKTPFSRQELYNDGVLQFPERSLATDAFKPSRDIGAMAAGSFGKGTFGYQVGVFGGEGQNTLRTDDHVMPVVRLVWNALGSTGATEADIQHHDEPALSIGVDGFTNSIRKTGTTTFDALVLNYLGPAGWVGRNIGQFETNEEIAIKSWEFETQFKWMGFSAQGEYYKGRAEGDTSGAKVYAYGWYAQAGYFILPEKLDVAARYSFVDYNRSTSHDGTSIVDAAANWYFHRNSVKLSLDYARTHRQRATGEPANDQAFLVQVQLMP